MPFSEIESNDFFHSLKNFRNFFIVADFDVGFHHNTQKFYGLRGQIMEFFIGTFTRLNRFLYKLWLLVQVSYFP